MREISEKELRSYPLKIRKEVEQFYSFPSIGRPGLMRVIDFTLEKKRCFPVILDALRHDESSIRKMAAETLQKIKTRKALEHLRKASERRENYNVEMQFSLARAIKQYDKNLAFDIFERVFNSYKNLKVDLHGGVALGEISEINTLKARQFIEKQISSKNQEEARQALQQILNRKNPAFVPMLVKKVIAAKTVERKKYFSAALSGSGEVHAKNERLTPKSRNFAFRLVDPFEHPIAFEKLYKHLGSKQFAGMDVNWWKTYAQQLKAVENNVKHG